MSQIAEGIQIEQYLNIARAVHVFRPAEIGVLKEVLDDYALYPRKNYILLDEVRDNKPVGFIVFGRTPLTRCVWDIYWLVVALEYRGQGIGRDLLKRAEEFCCKEHREAIFRIETSSHAAYAAARTVYTKVGFKEAGRIPDFYGEADDLITFYKKAVSSSERSL